jgi:hypothetical protein
LDEVPDAFVHRDGSGQDYQAEDSRLSREMDARFAVEIVFTDAVKGRKRPAVAAE